MKFTIFLACLLIMLCFGIFKTKQRQLQSDQEFNTELQQAIEDTLPGNSISSIQVVRHAYGGPFVVVINGKVYNPGRTGTALYDENRIELVVFDSDTIRIFEQKALIAHQP